MKDTSHIPYVELHCLSNFTFQHAASHPGELVKTAAMLGYKALAITDRCSFSGLVKAYASGKKNNLKIISGTELVCEDGMKVILLAENLASYQQISQLITKARRRKSKGHYQIFKKDLLNFSIGLLIWIPNFNTQDKDCAAWVRKNFEDRSWIGLGLFYSGKDQEHLEDARILSATFNLPITAVGDVRMHAHFRQHLLDTLTAIRLKKRVMDVGHNLFSNSERYLRPLCRIKSIYPKDLIKETMVIAARCNFTLAELKYAYPRELVSTGNTAFTELKNLTKQGMKKRWSEGVKTSTLKQVLHELSLIKELQYEGYFLMVCDIIAFAQSRGILYQGRGSAANSIVCYCLGITEVNPKHIDMLFERFISRERNGPPDIDIDFEHERREEVIQHIYAKYSRKRAAIAATIITYKSRSAIRDVGKALGVNDYELKRLMRSQVRWGLGQVTSNQIKGLGLDVNNILLKHLINLVSQVIGFPRHLSQHVGGFVITDAPLSDLVPIENAAMSNRTILQWDKNDLELLDILKIDCLSLGILTAISRSFRLIEEFTGERIGISDIPFDDPKTYSMIQQADTIGVFQIESRAQMTMLPRLKPKNYYDLIIQIAIIRPGPIQGEMVHPYLRRRNGEEISNYPDERVERVLGRTLGVPLFQEQIIRLAMVVAGFSPGEADQLRRSMTNWGESDHISKFSNRLLMGMRERGYSVEYSQNTLNQIKGFGGYGFPEAHAASFALLAYISAWLKCHKPEAYTAALLNSQPMGFYSPSQLVQDAKKHGVKVLSPDIQKSNWDCILEKYGDRKCALRLGFGLIKGLSIQTGLRIENSRSTISFRDMNDLVSRAKLNAKELRALSNANAFKSLVGNRHQANWKVLGFKVPLPLIPTVFDQEALPLLPNPKEGAETLADFASLGLTLGRHPMMLLRKYLTGQERVSTLSDVIPNTPTQVSGLVVVRQKPSSAKGVVFLTLEDETGSINVIVWPSLVETYHNQVMHSKLLSVSGKIQREGEVIHLIAEVLEDRSVLLGELNTSSRDFC